MTSIQEAAERLIEDAKSEYCGTGPYAGLSKHDRINDLIACGHAYLALTDPTPLDEEWLRSVNWASVGGLHWYRNEEIDANEPIISWHSKRRELTICALDGWKIENATRGQLRQLAAGLQIILKE